MQRGRLRHCLNFAIPPLLMVLGGASCAHPLPPTPTQFLFVTLPEKRSVAVFDAAASGDAKPLATIQESSPDTPIDVGMSMRGEIFVGNSNGTINVYAGAPRDYRRVRMLAGANTRMVHPVAMAVDQNGAIYLADRGAAPGQEQLIFLAPAQTGNVAPDRIVRGPHTGLTSPTGIAIDASEEVFVVDHDTGKVLIFADDANGDALPLATLGGLKGPQRVFVDQDLNVLVSCDGDDSIVVFAPDGPLTWTRSATITSAAMQHPTGVTADSSGNIAAAVQGAVLFFAAGDNGPSKPSFELEGPEPMNPTGLLIHN